MSLWFENFKKQFVLNFVTDNRWRYLVNGLGVTLKITFFSLIFGSAIGLVVAIIRSTYDKNWQTMRRGLGRFLLGLINRMCEIYITLIRGTPLVLQLLIFYFVIFVSIRDGVLVGILGFTINAGAYIAEIFRSGIMSIDVGQFEAGRSLGFNYMRTMQYIVIPQAFKVVLPTLVNEFIVLLKETAVVGYLAVQDLTKAADIIRGRTFSPLMPLIGAALIYLCIVMLFTLLAQKLERRLRDSER